MHKVHELSWLGTTSRPSSIAPLLSVHSSCTHPTACCEQCPTQLHEPHTAGNRNVTLRLGTRFYPKQQPRAHWHQLWLQHWVCSRQSLGSALTSTGMSRSAKKTKAAPRAKPTATGTKAKAPKLPECSAISIAGARRDQ